MPSQIPITPIRIDPELKARARAVLDQFPGETLNGWINVILRAHVEGMERRLLADQMTLIVKGSSQSKAKRKK